MNKPSKGLIIAQILLIFVLPVALLYFDVISYYWRILLLMLNSLVIYGIIRHENWTYEDMGLHHHNIKQAIPFYAFFTVLGVIALFIIDHKINMPDVDTKIFFIKTFAFFIPISFFQEFAFRAFLIPKLKEIFTSDYFVILSNAVLFTLIHIIYPNIGIGLPIAFVSGIFFAWLYIKYPNLLLVSASHMILNLTAVLLGFFHIS